MGIEALGRMVSVAAPAIGRGVGMGSAIGSRIGNFGMPRIEGGFSVSRISNPFKGVSTPKAASYIENRSPSIFGGIKAEVIKNPFKHTESPVAPRRILRPRVNYQPTLKVADVIAEAESIVRKAQVPVRAMELAKRPAVLDRKHRSGINMIVRTPEPARVVLPSPILSPKAEFKPASAPKVEARPQVATRVLTENKVASKTRVVTAPAPRQAQSEQVADRKATPDRKKEDSLIKRSEKENNLRFRLVEDTEVSQKRREAIKVAIKRARLKVSILGLTGISGRLVVKYLPSEYWERNDYQSGLVRGKSRDKTVDLTARAIERDTNEYQSEEDAQEKLAKNVTENRPVMAGSGEAVTFEEVRKVVEGEKGGKVTETFTVNSPAEIVINRVTREEQIVANTGQVISAEVSEKEEVRGEPTLKSLGLEELFQKAA